MTPLEPRGGEGLTSAERLHDVIGKIKRHIDLIQVAKRRVEAGGKLGRPDPLLACINDLPIIVRELDMAELEIEADFEAHEDRPTAPSASGGAVVAWRVWSGEGEEGLYYHEDVARENAGETSHTQPLFAHPARMPTREEVARVFAEDVLEQAERLIIRTELHDSPGMWRDRVRRAAILALFHTGETKGDDRG